MITLIFIALILLTASTLHAHKAGGVRWTFFGLLIFGWFLKMLIGGLA